MLQALCINARLGAAVGIGDGDSEGKHDRKHQSDTSAAVSWFWDTARFFTDNLHRCICNGTCLLCKAVGMHFADTSAAVHWLWVTAQFLNRNSS